MGKNFFGVEEWSVLYDVKFSQKQLRQAAEFPWGEDILNSTCPFCGKVVKDCHFAFLGLDRINGEPLTIEKWCKLHPKTDTGQLYTLHASDIEYHRFSDFFSNTTMSFRWYLLHKSIIPRSHDKQYREQLAMLTAADYEPPSAVTELTKNILVFRRTCDLVNIGALARCACTDRLGSHIFVCSVHYSRKIAFEITDCGYSDFFDVGLAASRKL
jgi:hypothetical protein